MQLDVFGEVVDALYQAERHGVAMNEAELKLAEALVDQVARVWREPDRGIWEVRGPPRRFTHSMVMAWAALDRGLRIAERTPSLKGAGERWSGVREEIRREVEALCYDREQRAFTQAAGVSTLDASTLLIPLVGFLPATDPRVVGTVAAIERRLMSDGFVRRYDPSETDDGIGDDEAAFLACSFWYADNLALQGRRDEARAMFERLVATANDVGLLAEEYDPGAGRLMGNFPQALSHFSLVNTAFNLAGAGPAERRAHRPGTEAETAGSVGVRRTHA